MPNLTKPAQNRILYLLLPLCLLIAATFYPIAPQRAQAFDTQPSTRSPIAAMTTAQRPALTGSFIQPWLVDGWSDVELKNHMKYMVRAGFEDIILQWTADTKDMIKFYSRDKKDEFHSSQTDVVDRILTAADAEGIKVHLGFQLNNDWWDKYANDSTWLTLQAEQSKKIATELWTNYGHHTSFAGWYFTFEVDNFHFATVSSWDAMAKYYNTVIAHVRAVSKRSLPISTAPFYNTSGGMVPAEWQRMWTHILTKVDFDILALQDGIGAAHATHDELGAWFAATRKAVDNAHAAKLSEYRKKSTQRYPRKTQLFADTETFDPEFYPDLIPMSITQLVESMKAVQPYVDGYWSFSYDHYNSPIMVSSVWDWTYRKYVETGWIEKQPPSVPTSVAVTSKSSDSVQFTWSKSRDNILAVGYYLERDGVVISRFDAPANCLHYSDNNHLCSWPVAPTTGGDYSPLPGATHTYRLIAFDAAGNRSAPSSPVKAYIPPKSSRS